MRIGRWFWTLVALVAAGVLFFALVVPRSSQRVDVSGWRDLAAVTVAGAYHVHTTRSDGLGDKAAVAAAARRAGLQFVIVTDHGDGTRAPDAPAYVDGVLCLDGVEISTDNGHYVALDMPRAPYPLGGSGDAVIRDVHRFGGFGVIAHPDSPKSALRWTGSYEGIDGIEWLNLDSEWRRDSRVRLVRAGLGYLIRPGPALATLFDRPETLARWDGLAARRQTVGLAAVDAHGGIQGSPAGGHEMGISGFPSYEASFKSITNRVVLDAPLTGDAPADARAVYSAIRHGRVFSTIDAVASPALLDFHLESAAGRVVMGGTLATVGAATIVARAPMPAASEMGLLRDGREVARSSTGLLRFDATQTKGAYRIEIHVPHAPGNPPIPWLVSNPIYVGITPEAFTVPLGTGAQEGTGAPFSWRLEKDSSSGGALRTTAHTVELNYHLADGRRESQYVALATDVRLDSQSAIRLALKGSRQMRLWVQVRSAEGTRWGRTFYVDPAGTTIVAHLADMRPLGQGTTARTLDPPTIRSLLIVIDLTNSAPGDSGWLDVLSSEISR